MKKLPAFLVVGAVAASSIVLTGMALSAPVINEIMYHAPGVIENPAEEWIEILNPDAAPVNVEGWALSKGVNLVFPLGNPDTLIQAGGYLVVAADRTAFLAAHSGFAGKVIGGWTGTLANSGEQIQLDDATGTKVDQVDYSDDGDWALRGRGPGDPNWLGHKGWEWFSNADGLGKSMELLNPLLKKNTGAAWRESTVNGGTPGAVNSTYSGNVAPVIMGVQFHPLIPRTTDTVRVTASVTDDLAAPATTTLRWRLDGEPTFSSLPMVDTDGDGDVEADIPPQANLSIIEFYVQTTDGALSRTWPSPARTSDVGVLPETFGQVCNVLLQVDNTYDPNAAWTPGSQPIHRVILTAVERAELRTIGEVDDNQNIKIDALMNATVTSVDGIDVKVRTLCGIRNRGFSSRKPPPNNFYIAFRNGDSWNGRKALQFNAKYPYAQVLGALCFGEAGIAEQRATPVQLRINGGNPGVPGDGVSSSFNAGITNGSYARIEPMGGDWVSIHYPLDPDGNLYRCDDHAPNSSTGVIGNDLGSGEFRYEGTTPANYEDTFVKKDHNETNTGPAPYNFDDLANLCKVISAPATGGNAIQPAISDAAYPAALAAVIDVDQWQKFFVVDALIGNMEGGLQSGRADDFGLYRGLIDQRFKLIPHDFDTCFTLGAAAGLGSTRSIFSYNGESPTQGTDGVQGLNRFFNHPDLLPGYYGKYLDALDKWFNHATLDPMIDQLLAGWSSAAAATAKNYIDTRRANILTQIPTTYSQTVTGNLADVESMKATSNATATFAGNFNVAKVRSIQVGGVNVPLTSSNYRKVGATPAGTWSFTGTAANGVIKPGVNQIVTNMFDGPNGTGATVQTFTALVYSSAGTGTPVLTNGVPVFNSLALKAPSSYIPGIPFLVEVEYRDASGVPDLTAWDKTAVLTASNGVTLTTASTGGGAAAVPVRNGRGSLLVTAGGGGGSGGPQVLFSRGSSWKYLDDGSNQGTGWRLSTFNDTTWSTGNGEFGRANPMEGDEVTQLNGTPGGSTPITATGSHITYYFRKKFTVANPALYSAFTLKLLRDDAAIVYLNATTTGTAPVKADTDGLNVATTTSTTRSTVSRDAVSTTIRENVFYDYTIPPSAIVAGENVIAVEIHQGAPSGSNDISFDAEVIGTLIGGGGGTDPGNFTITATADSLTASKGLTSLTPTPTMTTKTGTLTGSETWSGVINVTGDVTVPVGATLTINPGTHVLVDGTAFGGGGSGGINLLVNGALSAVGTEVNPISITCSNAANRWGEIRFGTATASTLGHCLISRAGHSVGGGHTGTGPMVRITGTALTIEDSVLADSPGKVLTTINTGGSDISGSNLVVRRSHLARCVMGPEIGGAGLIMEDTHCTHMLAVNRESGAQNDEDCIYIHDSGGRTVNVQRSVFAHCDDDAIDLLGGTVLIEGSISRNAMDKGASLLENDFATFRRHLFIDNDIGVSSKIQGQSAAGTPYVNTLENCTIFCENHPLNTGDGTIHSYGIHTRNKNNTTSMNITWNVKNCIISAEVPVANDYPTLGSTTYPLMNMSYCCYHDLSTSGTPEAMPSGTGDIVADPLYVDSVNKNFKLQAVSPCRDTGDPALPNDADATRSDMGRYPYGGNVSAGTSLLWSLAGSPYHVTASTTIPTGSTLTIEPGVNVYFDKNVRLTVNGRILAQGNANARIRFSHLPGQVEAGDCDPIKVGTQTGPSKWGGVRIIDSMSQENIVAFADFVNAQGLSPLDTTVTDTENWGGLGSIKSWVWVDNCTWTGSHLRWCYGRCSKLTVSRCNFGDMFDPLDDVDAPPAGFISGSDNKQEPLKVEYKDDALVAGNPAFVGGFPVGGWFRVYYNDFHGNKGHNDVFDGDGGRVGVSFPLDCRYNHFHGLTGDEHMDLKGDALIANNIIEHGTKDQWTSDTGYSNAISTDGAGAGTTNMVARNLVFDMDHLINCKASVAAYVEHNTVANMHADFHYAAGPPYNIDQNVKCSVVNMLVENDSSNNPPRGDGCYMGFNLISNVPRLISAADKRQAGTKDVFFTDVTTKIEFEQNIVDQITDTTIGANHPGGIFNTAYGTNIAAVPGFVDPATKDYSLKPNSAAKGSGPGGIDIGWTCAEWAYIHGAPPVQTPSTTASLTVGGPGLIAYKWRIDGGAWSAPITIGSGAVFPRSAPTVRTGTISLSGLANGPHTVEVLGQDFAGNWQDNDPAKTYTGRPQFTPTAASWTVNTALALLQINEVYGDTNPATPTAPQQIVELRYNGAAPLDLSGWSLSDSILTPGEQPLTGVLNPGDLLAVMLGVMRIDNDGDDVYLFDPFGVVKDSVSFGPLPAGYSLGRIGQAGAWTLCSFTQGTANAAVPLGDASAVRISEFLASGAVHFKEDFVELHNLGTLPVSISGLKLSDNWAGEPSAFTFPPYSYLAPDGYQEFIADGSVSSGANHLSFSLDAQQEELVLLSGTTVLDRVLFYPQNADYSQSRTAGGVPVYYELPTQGFANGTSDPAYANALAILRGLRITEIMYDPTGGNNFEFIELRNIGATSLQLEGVQFTAGIAFTFPGYSLGAGQNIILAANAASLQARYPGLTNVLGNYTKKLSNSGDTIAFQLAPPFDANILCFHYDNGWIPSTNGGGKSLEIINPGSGVLTWGDKDSWQASANTGGSPDGLTALVPNTYSAWLAFYAQGTGATDTDFDGISPLMEYALGKDPGKNGGVNGQSEIPIAATEPSGKLHAGFYLPVNASSTGGYGMPGVTYKVVASNDMTASNWVTLTTKTATTDWTPALGVQVGAPLNGYVQVIVTDVNGQPLTQPHRFMRLVVTTP